MHGVRVAVLSWIPVPLLCFYKGSFLTIKKSVGKKKMPNLPRLCARRRPCPTNPSASPIRSSFSLPPLTRQGPCHDQAWDDGKDLLTIRRRLRELAASVFVPAPLQL